MELQAVVDDSGKGVKPVYVLAGFVLSAYQWIVFAEHWQAILDAAPKIPYFKMHEAWHLSEQFSRFSTQQRDEKVTKFVSLIIEYRPLALKEVIHHSMYDRVFKGKIAPGMDYPYLLPCSNIVGTLARYQYNNEWHPNDPVDFIFDEQGKESDKVQRVWSYGLQFVPLVLKPLIGGKPINRNDKDFLPLQAADLFAWHVRRFYEEKSRGQEYMDPHWKSLKSLKCAEYEWTEEHLQKICDGVRKTGQLFEYDIKSKKVLKRHKRALAERFEEQDKDETQK
jgi:hypothetical protein